MNPAFWIGIAAAIAIPLLVRHVQYRTHESEGENVSSSWLRRNR